MPANKKYLLQNRWARISKILAAIIGALSVTLMLLSVAGLLWSKEMVVLTIWFSFPLLWGGFIAVVYWIKSPARVWALFLTLLAIGAPIIYFFK